MSAVKSIYQFVLRIQIITLVIFLFWLADNGFSLPFDIEFKFSEDWSINFEFQFDYLTILGFLAVVASIFVLSSVNVAASGLSTEGTLSIKQLTIFISRFLLLLTPITYFLGQSEQLNELAIYITLILLVIHLLNYLEVMGGNVE